MAPLALIDFSALRHNLERAKQAAPRSKIMAVVKSNAYGHGMLRIARALSGQADALALARVEEAVTLRRAGIDKPLMVLEGFFDVEELRAASDCRLSLGISRPEQLALLESTQLRTPVRCWLKINTGMNRLGFPPISYAESLGRLQAAESVAKAIGLMSHFANADNRADETTGQQLARFNGLTPRPDGDRSLANSAGILGWPDSHLEWVRPGIMLYGSSPFSGGRGEEEGLRPVMTLSSQLIAVNHCRRGDPVGYGGHWRCPEAMPVGVVAIGYGDGYPRHAGNGTPVLVNGCRVPLIGRVSMDMITVDLRTQRNAKVGDPVVLWGAGLAAEEVADAAATISYELYCGVTSRVRFQERDDGGH